MKHFRWTGLLVLLITLLIACGGDATPPAAESDTVAVEPTAAPAEAVAHGDPAAGAELYTQSCSSCHGPDGKGVEGIGKDLTSGEFIPSLSDEEFVTFIKQGRPTGDPLNTSGIDMPPKGGNPALSDEDIMHLIAYIRSIHQ